MGTQRNWGTGTVVWAIVGAALLSGLGGCKMNSRARTVPLQGEALPAGAALAVDVDNRAGTVVVRVDPRVTAPIVRAQPADGSSVKKEKPWAAADLAQQDERWVLRVMAGAGETEGTPVIVTVTVPACEGVRVKNAGGPVTLKGVGGAISVTNSDLGGQTARIAVDTTRDLTAPVTLISTGGDVVCKAGSGSVGKLTLTTPRGRHEVQTRSKVLTNGKNLPAGWEANLGGSDNPITLTTERGNAIFELY